MLKPMLRSIANKPHWFLLLLIPVILLLVLTKVGSTVDVQLHDTYLVIAPLHLGLFLSSFICGLSGCYWLVRKKKLINWITVTHVIATGIGFFIITVLALTPKVQSSLSGVNYFSSDYYQTILVALSLVILIGLFSQVMFVANLTIGVIRSKSKQ